MARSKMSNPIIRIHNQESGETIDREMTAEEFSAYEEAKVEQALRAEAEKEKAQKRAELLDRLGLTEDEARILLG